MWANVPSILGSAARAAIKSRFLAFPLLLCRRVQTSQAFVWSEGRRSFNVVRSERDMRWMFYRGIAPNFAIVPGIVAGELASLEWSAFWCDVVPPSSRVPGYRTRWPPADLVPHLSRYHRIFVGGSLPWKLATGAMWTGLARRYGLCCHIGRFGTAGRVRWAQEIGATSVDSCLPLRHREHLTAFLAALSPQTSSPACHHPRGGDHALLGGQNDRRQGSVMVLEERALEDEPMQADGFRVPCT